MSPTTPPPVPLTPEEIDTIQRSWAELLFEHRGKVAMLIVLDTGLGLDEMLVLSVVDVNLEMNTIFTPDNRIVPISEPTVKAIREWLEVRPQRAKEGYFFTQENGLPLASRQHLHKDMRLFGKSIGTRYRITDLRATYHKRLRYNVPVASKEQIKRLAGRGRGL